MCDTIYGTYRGQIKVWFLTVAYIWKPRCGKLWVNVCSSFGREGSVSICPIFSSSWSLHYKFSIPGNSSIPGKLTLEASGSIFCAGFAYQAPSGSPSPWEMPVLSVNGEASLRDWQGPPWELLNGPISVERLIHKHNQSITNNGLSQPSKCPIDFDDLRVDYSSQKTTSISQTFHLKQPSARN